MHKTAFVLSLATFQLKPWKRCIQFVCNYGSAYSSPVLLEHSITTPVHISDIFSVVHTLGRELAQ